MAKKSVPLGVRRPIMPSNFGEILRGITEVQISMEKKYGPPPAGHINSKDLERLTKEAESGK